MVSNDMYTVDPASLVIPLSGTLIFLIGLMVMIHCLNLDFLDWLDYHDSLSGTLILLIGLIAMINCLNLDSLDWLDYHDCLITMIGLMVLFTS